MFIKLPNHNLLKSLSRHFSAPVLVLTLGLLSACGFQFRGSYLLPDELQTLHISSVDRHGELTRIVKQHLTLNQVNLSKTKKTDITQVHILRDHLERRVLSILPNGQVAEYELIYTVRYQLIQADNPPQNFIFTINRDYQDDPNAALAKSRELDLLLSEMRKEAADRLLRNLASLKRQNSENNR